MSKHTHEPWFLSKVDNGISYEGGLAIDAIDTSNGKLLEICEVWGVDDDREHDERSMANARRIVACVNACAGVDTDLLEAGELGKPTMLVIQENKDLKHRCDELLAALEFVMSARGEQLESAFAQAQNAISKAKGV